MDAIARDIILKLTSRVANLEAAVEVDRTLLRDLAHEQALATGKTFDPAAFDLQRSEAITHQREKMAMDVEEKETIPATPFVLDLPEVEQDPV